ncbi:MAG TPA: HD domain-containing protein [Anaerolineaceae bacterium]|nr:HD domain-containing protein [Anaerolineaceae bacterium]
MVKKPDFEKAKDYALDKLANEISPDLTYHNLLHTHNEVVPAADRLANLEKVSEKDHLLLLTAAYFHDLGFIRQRKNHESISIQLAEQALPGFGYSDADIAVIRGIIQATRLPQSPKTHLERIMADADMDDLGHENFWKRSQDLRQEEDNYGTKFTDQQWYTNQLHLMESHHYFTDSERLLRDSLKQQHILEVKRLLEQVTPIK